MTVLIRDDGSTDKTLSVVTSFASRNDLKNEYRIIRDEKGNLGCPTSFYQIIRSQQLYDFYAFCDQDDIWLPHKIERAIKAISRLDDKQPIVYYSSFDYCDENLNLIRHAPKQPPVLKLPETLFYTPGLGFTIVLNSKACKKFILDVNPGKQMHDRWILRCGACMGKVLYDQSPTALHIRHADAVTADDNRSTDLLKHYLKNELCGSDADDSRKKIAYFLNTFRNELDKKDIKTLELFGKKKKTPLNNIRKALFPCKLRASIPSELSLRLLLLIGKA